MIGQVVIVDQGPGGAGQYICLRRNGSQLTVVPTSPATAYKPIHLPDVWVVGAMDIPEVLSDAMFGLSKMLTSNNVTLAAGFRVQAQQTLGMMRAAFHEVSPCRWPNFQGQEVEALGRNNAYETLVFLRDDGQHAVVVTEQGCVTEIEKQEWLFGQSFDGERALLKLCQRYPDNRNLKHAYRELFFGQN